MKLKHVLKLIVILFVLYIGISFLTKSDYDNTRCEIHGEETIIYDDVQGYRFIEKGAYIQLINGTMITTSEPVYCYTEISSLSILNNVSKQSLINIIAIMYMSFVLYHFIEYKLWEEYDKGLWKSIKVTFWLAILPISPYNIVIKYLLKDNKGVVQ